MGSWISVGQSFGMNEGAVTVSFRARMSLTWKSAVILIPFATETLNFDVKYGPKGLYGPSGG